MKNAFSLLHPFVHLLYFGFILTCCATILHPFFLFSGLFGAICYQWTVRRFSSVIKLLHTLLPFCIIGAAVNPLFNHQGIHILAYLPSGNPLTLESIAYGLATGAMLAGMLCWFSCLQFAVNSDQILYITEKVSKTYSLLLSMTLQFIPKFQKQLVQVRRTQLSVRRHTVKKNLLYRIRLAFAIFCSTAAWALEHSVETGLSMKSRGYGCGKRTSFSLFRWSRSDSFFTILLICLAVPIVFAVVTERICFRYFPFLYSAKQSSFTSCVFAAYLILCLLPSIVNVHEKIAVRRIRKKHTKIAAASK